jgi:FGGY-family pentulose kinase
MALGEKDYVLGIDMGTGGARVGIFDLKGNPVVFYEERYELYTPKSGWAEQKPDEWWASICKASRNAVKEAGIDPKNIIGMSADTTCCTVLAGDADFNPIGPAIMWMDVRASDQARRITQCGCDALKYNGYGNVSAECMPAKALWMKENDKERYERASYIYECTDWLMHRLTGNITASIDTTSARWYYNKADGGWPVDLYDKIGIGDTIEKFPSRVVPMGECIGNLTAEAAGDLGLRPGIPVGEGGADAFVGMIGLGAVAPGRIALITGSSHLHLALSEQEIHHKGMWGSYPDAVVPGLQLVEGGQTSTGSIVNWFKNNYCGNIETQAKEKGVSIYDILNEEASKLPVGAEGLIALDYFQGNRTPYVDPDVRGMFYGLSLKHTPVYMYRAIIEGICYGTERILQVFRESGMKTGSIYISGGAVKSPFWTQVHADVSNLPIHIPKVSEAPCLGSAILGAVAAGVYEDIPAAAGNMTSMLDTVQPDAGRHEEYMFYYRKYAEAYTIMKEWMHEVTRHNAEA